MFPGITPLNVWDLDLDGWLTIAVAADDWNNETRRNNNRRR